ncbi:MAG TPA: DUF3501 family protein [Nitrospiria bacterium]|nr:DUF3501 family protein [Nitrospiria bacterium]
MRKLVLQDIMSLGAYEAVRNDFKKKIIDLKRDRRIGLGEILTLIFENRETVKLQIQEMMRVEHIYDDKKIQDEINIYNALIPGPGELSATLLIEITDEKKIKPLLDSLIGLDNGKSVYFKIGETKVFAVFEEGHSEATKISAVHYVRFIFSPESIAAWKEGNEDVLLVADHPNYHAECRIKDEARLSLAGDWSEAGI